MNIKNSKNILFPQRIRVIKKVNKKVIKDLEYIQKKLNDHKFCVKAKDGRIPSLYCRLILEYISQVLLLIAFKKRKILFKNIKNNIKKTSKTAKIVSYENVFEHLDTKKLLDKLRGNLINRRDNGTVPMYSAMQLVEHCTNEALHLKIKEIKKGYEINKKNYDVTDVVAATNRIIEDFIGKFEKDF